MTNEQILEIFNRYKPLLINYALQNNSFKYGVTSIDLEQEVDELPLKIIKAKKSNFNDEAHLRRYLFVALNNNIRFLYARKRIENAPELTVAERKTNFNLAKTVLSRNAYFSKDTEISDNILKITGIEMILKKLDKKLKLR